MDKITPKIAILLAAYNGQKYLAEQIESVLNQEDVSVSIYIRLDPSSDNSADLIDEFVKSNCNVILLKAAHPSGSAGQNFFTLLIDVDFSEYDFVAFSDQDDIWFQKKLIRAIDCLKLNNSDAYSGNVLAWWDSGKKRLVEKAGLQRKFDYLFESAGPGCTFLFTKNLAFDFKMFLVSLGSNIDKLWLHDWFCYAFARSRGYSWFIDSKPMMLYRQHGNNVVGANSGFSAFSLRMNEVLTGKAFDRVISQAIVIGEQDKEPIRLIQNDNIISTLKLALKAFQCRRKRSDQLMFIFAMLLSIFKFKK